MNRTLRLSLVVLCAGTALPAWAGTDDAARPLWEAGIAAGAGRVPDYPGADHRRVRGIVLPYLVYRGPLLRIDEAGVRGRLFVSSDWQLELTATGAFNARANEARAGMPDLDYLFGVGPQLIYKGLQRRLAGPTLHLKWRALMSTDFKRLDGRGSSFDPELRWRLERVGETPLTLTLSVQPSWTGRPLARYFYEVDPAYATPQRPAYRARAGYLGTEVGATLSHALAPGLSWFATAGLSSWRGSANAASPLLREREALTVGAGIVWTPWRSQARAAD